VTPHLRGHVRAYVDRALPAALLRVFDQHLVACEVCRASAEQERRIVAALRADTGVPQSLRSTLMSLAAAQPDVPGVPQAPARVRMHLPASPFRDPQPLARQPVPTVSPNAPALHRSPVRAAVVASLAATASVAAAWGLTVVPLQAVARTPATARVPVDATSFGPSPFSQAVSSSTAPSRTTGTLDSPRSLRLAASGPSSEAALQRELTASTPTWAATTALGLPDVITPVRISVVRSAESRP
jgi:hypothetical protein